MCTKRWSLVVYCLLLLVGWPLGVGSQTSDQGWEERYLKLQQGVLEIIPSLRQELLTAKADLETSRIARENSEIALRKSQEDLSALESERKTSLETSRLHEQNLSQQSQQISALEAQLTALWTLWGNWKNSLEETFRVAQQAIDHADRLEQRQVFVSAGFGIGGLILGGGFVLLLGFLGGGR